MPQHRTEILTYTHTQRHAYARPALSLSLSLPEQRHGININNWFFFWWKPREYHRLNAKYTEQKRVCRCRISMKDEIICITVQLTQRDSSLTSRRKHSFLFFFGSFYWILFAFSGFYWEFRMVKECFFPELKQRRRRRIDNFLKWQWIFLRIIYYCITCSMCPAQNSCK